MDHPVVTPIRDTLTSDTRRQFDAVAGEVDMVSDVTTVDMGHEGISEEWLDELAGGLTDSGWMSLDVRNHLGDGLLSALRDEVRILDVTDAMKKAGIGRGADLTRDRSVRRDRIAWLQGITPAQRELFRCLERIREGLNRRLFLGLKRFESHYATYQSGDFYRKHVDSFAGRASRVVSLVLYFNEDWRPSDGGELQVFNRDSPDEVCGLIQPEMGRMVLFLSEEIPHEVLPANRARYSLACWFRQDEVPLPL
ncbi:2OG-Fe(II) oxygenase [Marinobacter lipolyticus]|uniref:2OG-Fe(II) oxygenase n=1 Tax=Marinobacter lipolyticus TaxID=209639 RepID=UPI003A91654D